MEVHVNTSRAQLPLDVGRQYVAPSRRLRRDFTIADLFFVQRMLVSVGAATLAVTDSALQGYLTFHLDGLVTSRDEPTRAASAALTVDQVETLSAGRTPPPAAPAADGLSCQRSQFEDCIRWGRRDSSLLGTAPGNAPLTGAFTGTYYSRSKCNGGVAMRGLDREPKLQQEGNARRRVPPTSLGSNPQFRLDHLSPTALLSLQGSAGNRSTMHLLRADETQRHDAEPTEPRTMRGSLGSQIVDTTTAQTRGPDDRRFDHAGSTSDTAEVRRPVEPGGELKVQMGKVNLTTGPSSHKLEPGNTGRTDDLDPRPTNVDVQSSTRQMTVDPFGEADFFCSWANARYDVVGDAVMLDFTINVDTPWGINSGGAIDIASASSPEVSTEVLGNGVPKYQQIVHDLTPVLEEKSWRAPREYYWSSAICKRHEKFHNAEDTQWAEGPGKRLVTDYIEGYAVDSSDLANDLRLILDAAMNEMKSGAWDNYTGGASTYLSRAGEERAFGDGKAPYEALAEQVRVRGETLAAGERAAAARSQQPALAPVNPVPAPVRTVTPKVPNGGSTPVGSSQPPPGVTKVKGLTGYFQNLIEQQNRK